MCTSKLPFALLICIMISHQLRIPETLGIIIFRQLLLIFPRTWFRWTWNHWKKFDPEIRVDILLGLAESTYTHFFSDTGGRMDILHIAIWTGLIRVISLGSAFQQVRHWFITAEVGELILTFIDIEMQCHGLATPVKGHIDLHIPVAFCRGKVRMASTAGFIFSVNTRSRARPTCLPRSSFLPFLWPRRK